MKSKKNIKETHGASFSPSFYLGRSHALGISGGGADSSYSSHMGQKKVPVDYYSHLEDEEDEEEEEDTILEMRVYKDGRYKIIETLDKIQEVEEEEEDPVEEVSTVASLGGGPTPPLGRKPDGSFANIDYVKALRKKFQELYK